MRIHRHRNRAPKIQIPQFAVNEKITAPTLRVIDDQGNQLGVLETNEALRRAREKQCDLVEVSPKADPPVARFLDFGQFKYQKEKEIRKQRAQSKEVDTKGIRLSFRIGEHDLDVRLEQARKFLERGDKIRVEIVLRGREKSHAALAREVIENFINRLQQFFPLRIEQAVSKQQNQLTAIVARG